MNPDLAPFRIDVKRAASPAQRPLTSIIILVTVDPSRLFGCLESLDDRNGPADDCEVVVLANGTDASRLNSVMSRRDTTVVRSPVNLGFAAGCNLAARYARGDRLAFLNDDTVVRPGWLQALNGALDADPGLGVVGSRVLLDSSTLQEAGSVVWRDGSTSGIGRGRAPYDREFDSARPVDYVSFCAALIRRAVWDEVGGFDTRYFPTYYEDADLCMSALSRGWLVMYEPRSVVMHHEGGSAATDFRSFVSRRNQAAFVAKWSATLTDHEPAPADEASRPAAIDRALQRVAARPRQLPARGSVAPAAADGGDNVPGDIEAAVLMLTCLRRALEVDEAFIGWLRQQTSTPGAVHLAKRALHPVYRWARRAARTIRIPMRARGEPQQRRRFSVRR